MPIYVKPEYEAIAKPSSVILEMAEKAGFPFMKVADLFEDIQKNMLRSWFTGGQNTEVDDLVKKAWKGIFQYDFSNLNDDRNVTPFGVLGPPGQGKTTVFASAMAQIAQVMGVKFHVNPPEHIEIGPLDMVLRTLILAGEVSTTSMSGVPNIQEKDNDGKALTYFAPPKYLHDLQHNAFSVMIADDALNAHSHIQNGVMDLIQTKVFRSTYIGENTYCSLTGNLGAIDGTNVNKQSSALTGRVRSIVAGDTAGDFCNRAHIRYIDNANDNYGSCYIIDFILDNLEQNPTLFYEAPDRKKNGPHTSSRTLDNLIDSLRNTFADHDMAVKAGAPTLPLFTKIENMCPQFVGRSFSDDFCAYVEDLITIARPTASELLEHGTLSDKTRQKFKHALQTLDAMQSERLARGLLRQVQNSVVNDIFYGLQKLLPPVVELENPNMDEKTKQKLLNVGKEKAAKAFHVLSEACFGVGMVSTSKQNLIMNTYQSVVTELIKRSELDVRANNTLFGVLDSAGQPIASKALFKQLVDVAKLFDVSYSDGEALNVVNKQGGKDTLAIETCLVLPLSAMSEVERIAKEAEQFGMVLN